MLLADLRHGFRALRKTPLMTAVAVLSLALGIGANTLVFTLVNAILLRQLPVKEPAQLQAIHTVDSRNPGLLLISYPNYKDYRDRNTVFSSLAVYSIVGINLTDRGDPQLIGGHLVSGNYFSTLGINPMMGRWFLPEEDAAEGASPVVVLSYRFWVSQFGADPGILSQSIHLNGRPYTVVGIAPEGFVGLNALYRADVWAPMAMAQALYPSPALVERRRSLLFAAVGRLRPDVSAPQAEAGMQVLAAELERQYPADNEGRRIQLTTLAEAALAPRTRDAIRNASLVLTIVSWLVLLISCGNVANLLLARGAARRKDITVRLALGASRWQLVRELLTESMLLALLGSAAGLALARWGRDAVWALRPPVFNYAGIDLTLDSNVLVYTVFISMATGILFGLAPALRATRQDLAMELKERSGRSAPVGRWQLRTALVSAQVAFSVVALVGAGLFVRSMRNITWMDPGFDAAHLGMVKFNVGYQGYNEARGREYQRRVRELAAASPGVQSATLSKDSALRVSSSFTALPDGRSASGKGRPTMTAVVWPGYFRTMGISLLRGRDFTESDSATTPRVAIINQTAAAHFWPGEDPIGRIIRFAGDHPAVQVVGVARTTNYLVIGEEPQAMLYFSLVQSYAPMATLYVRTNGDPAAVSADVRKRMQSLDRSLLLESESFNSKIRESLWAQRLSGSMLAVFGGLALLLSSMGVYGVISYSVNQRVREFGVRMALGATRAQVQTMVLGEGMRLVTIGAAAGTVFALGAAQLVQSMLVGVSARDAGTFLLAPSILTVVAVVACWAPALRATRIDPAITLRDE